MRIRPLLLPLSLVMLSLVMLASCSNGADSPAPTQAVPPAADAAANAGSPARTANYVEGRDYMILERARFMDDTGFERPAEAFSVLVPRGWTHDGGIVWKGLQECRAEMVSGRWNVSSPDGAIRFQSLPTHAWGSASDSMMRQALQMQAQAGGCEVAGVIDAEQYLREVFAPRALQGATITEVKENEEATQQLRQAAAKSADAIRQMGAQVESLGRAVVARLTWPDGTEGIVFCSVLNGITTMQNPYTGGLQRLTNSIATERSVIRFAPERRAEAETFLTNLKSSLRTNPQWQQAIDGYFARLRQQQNAEHHMRMRAIEEQTAANTRAHQQRMADIQRQGAANTQRFEQRMADMDGSMRSWEAQQNSQDRMHTAFVQSIREVETWQGGDGSVELSSGYDQAWSRGDGTYVLSNSPSFDPRSVFQDQNWQEMKRAHPATSRE